MSDTEPSAELLFEPGTTIEFADITELHAFEDALAPIVQPNLNSELWISRVALKELLRPAKFNGRMANLALTTMDQPYERLLDATERGWTMMYGAGYARKNTTALSGTDRYLGFAFTADAMSSGRGKIGQVQAELWYAPNPRRLYDKPAYTGTYRQRYTSKKTGQTKTYEYQAKFAGREGAVVNGSALNEARPLLRVTTKPKIESENFAELLESSQRIGFQVLRNAMMRPIRNGMRS